MLALIVVPVLCLGALEISLRVLHYGYPTDFFLRHRIDDREKWVENDRFGLRFFPRSLVRRPPPLVMDGEKDRGVYRIFVFGESAAMGDPDPSFSFSRILQVLLHDRFPNIRFEVVNVAFTAINSHVILPLARECGRHAGDLWVIYMGNNEVMGPFGAATVLGGGEQSLALIRGGLALKEWKTGQCLDDLSLRLRREHAVTNAWSGLQMFAGNELRADDPKLKRVYGNFQKNLQEILSAAKSSGVKVVTCTVGSNLKDFSPFASIHSKDLNREQREAWEKNYQAGTRSESSGAFNEALGHYLSAAQLDAGFADLQFRMGRCYLAVTNFVDARKCFEAARDLDALRFRADSTINRLIQETCNRSAAGTAMVLDAAELLARKTASSVPGDESFFDHVHLTYDGNFLLASAMAEQVAKILSTTVTQGDAGRWLSTEECGKRLALTGWNQYQLWQSMQQRLMEPPFTNQWDHALRQGRYREKLAQLKPMVQPDGLAQAEAVYQQALAAAPNDYYLHENFGRLLHARGDLDGAAAQFGETARLLPHSPTAEYNLGFVLNAHGKSESALNHFNRALALRADYPEAHNGAGQALAALGRTNDAMAAFHRALELRPVFPEALVNLGSLWQRHGNVAQAKECFEKAVALQPESAATHLRLGNLLTQQGQLLEAGKHLAEAVRLQPETFSQFLNAVRLNQGNAIAHFHLANALAAQDQRAEAVKSLQKAVELDANFWEARYLLGVEMAVQNSLSEAEFQFSEVVRLRPDFALGHLNLGVALARQKKWTEAFQQFQQTLRLDPTNKQAQQYVSTIQSMARPK